MTAECRRAALFTSVRIGSRPIKRCANCSIFICICAVRPHNFLIGGQLTLMRAVELSLVVNYRACYVYVSLFTVRQVLLALDYRAQLRFALFRSAKWSDNYLYDAQRRLRFILSGFGLPVFRTNER